MDLLRNEGSRLKSVVLSAMAMHVAADPFKTVKKLIQDLVERLVSESTAEATKKGFCDMELGKSKKDRGYRLQAVKRLNAELGSLQAKKDQLGLDIEENTDAGALLETSLGEATVLRVSEKTENTQTLKTAEDGLEAVKKAIAILQAFYQQAAKATVLLQVSPVAEDTSGPGFTGAYQGKQAGSKAVLGILEVIKSDFERTIRTTTQSEKAAAVDFVKFDRSSRSARSAKGTKVTLDTEDHAQTVVTIESKMSELKDNMDLLDQAIARLEELKPMCIASGMEYDERVAKREEEIHALKRALCILDADRVEVDDCNEKLWGR